MTQIKDTFESGENPLGTWLSIGHPKVAEAAARLDLDFVLIDMEHTTMSLETVEEMARGVEAAPGDTACVIRIPWNDPVRLKRVVDIGVSGVMVPMVESADEARSVVRSLRYPPDGIRGIGGSRATGYGRNFEEYVETANGSILTIVQIETEAGLENASEIAGIGGIDAIFVGPADLSGALGIFGEWESDEFASAMDTIIEAGKKHNVPVGTLTTDLGQIKTRISQGFDYLIAGKDITLIMDGIDEAITIYHNERDRTAPVSQE